MGTLSTDNAEATTASYPRPVDENGTLIIYDGNPAKALACLIRARTFYERTGHYSTLLKKNAVRLSNGKYAVDSIQSAPFVLGVITELSGTEAYSFAKPAPSTPERIKRYETRTKTTIDFGAIAKTMDTSSIIFNPDTVEEEKRAFANSLALIIKDPDLRSDLLRRSDYNGIKLIGVLYEESKKATPMDQSLVSGKLTTFIAAPFGSELTLKSFNAKLREYDDVKTDAGSPADEQEAIGLLTRWIYHDTTYRERFENKLIIVKPTTRAGYVALIRELLRATDVAEEIDADIHGGIKPALVTPAAPAAADPAPNPHLAAIAAALAKTGKRRNAAVRDALIAAGVDPVKNLRDKGPNAPGGKTKLPRLPDGSIDFSKAKWSTGMQLCKCLGAGSPTGVNDGGKHLYATCTKKDTPPPDHKSNVVLHLRPGMSDADMDEVFKGFFSDVKANHVSNVSFCGQDVLTASDTIVALDVESVATGLGVRTDLAASIHALAVPACFETDADPDGISLQAAAYSSACTQRALIWDDGLIGNVGGDPFAVSAAGATATHVSVSLGSDVALGPLIGSSSPPPPPPDPLAEILALVKLSLPPPLSPLVPPLPPSGMPAGVLAEPDLGGGGATSLSIAGPVKDHTISTTDTAAALPDIFTEPVVTNVIPASRFLPGPGIDLTRCLDADTHETPQGTNTKTLATESATEPAADPPTPETASLVDKNQPTVIDKTTPPPEEANITELAKDLARAAARKALSRVERHLHQHPHLYIGGICLLMSMLIVTMMAVWIGSTATVNMANAADASGITPLNLVRGSLDQDQKPNQQSLLATSDQALSERHQSALTKSKTNLGPIARCLALALFVALIWPGKVLLTALAAPISLITTFAYALFLPLMSPFHGAIEKSRVGLKIMPKVAKSMNKIGKALPLTVTLIVALSSWLIPAASSTHGAGGLTKDFSTNMEHGTVSHVDLPNSSHIPFLELSGLIPQSHRNFESSGESLGPIISSFALKCLESSDPWSSRSSSASAYGAHGPTRLEPNRSLVSPVSPSDTKHTLSNVMSSAKSRNVPIMCLVPDSGASASSVTDCGLLKNVRPCNEIFGDANGRVTRAISIGDLPVIASTASGEVVDFSFTNVRCVPQFKFSLLSVRQMWDEQRIDARWRDLNHLELPASAGGHKIPFDNSLNLSTLIFISAAKLGLGARSTPHELIASYQTFASESKTSTDSASALASSTLDALSLVGFHSPGSTSHIRDMSSAQASEFAHRRYHCAIAKIRKLPDTAANAPRNLSSALAITCPHCAAAQITKARHSSSLPAPAPEPGNLHTDLKGPFPNSIHGYKYAIFFTDEFSRYVFVRFLKTKSESEQIHATKSVIAEFNSIVFTPTTSDGRPLPRPTVRHLRRDHESAMESHGFESFRVNEGFHTTASPPHDHDLNPISERVNRTISEKATAMNSLANGPPAFWAHAINHAVNVHNALPCSAGSSAADPHLSPFQRLTLKLPKIMDLAAWGCRSVAMQPPQDIKKSLGLSPRGAVANFLGRSLDSSVSAYDFWDGKRVITTSSGTVDEDYYPWRGNDAHQPLSPTSRSPPQPQPTPLHPQVDRSKSGRGLTFLNLFSGPYHRTHGLSSKLSDHGWSKVTQIDNAIEGGGGHLDDLLANDSLYVRIKQLASEGAFDCILIAFPCSTFSAARFFDASKGDPTKRRGPEPVRTHDHPDGLPLDQVKPDHHKELRDSTLLLKRAFEIAIIARQSSAKTTIIVENPADRSIEGTVPYLESLKNHGSLFATTEFKKLREAIGIDASSMATFAYCRLGSRKQKYTTLFYTNDAAPVLDKLNSHEYQCNHPKDWHEKVGGLKEDDTWASADAAPYPDLLNDLIVHASTLARTGSSLRVDKPEQPSEAITQEVVVKTAPAGHPEPVAQHLPHLERPPDTTPSATSTPVAFRGFGGVSPSDHASSTPQSTSGSEPPSRVTAGVMPPPPPSFNPDQPITEPPSNRQLPIQGAASRGVRGSTRTGSIDAHARQDERQMSLEAKRASRAPRAPRPVAALSPVTEQPSPPSYETFEGEPTYPHATLSTTSALTDSSIDSMESCVAELIYDASLGTDPRLEPVSQWVNTTTPPHLLGAAVQLDKNTFAVEVDAHGSREHVALLSKAMGITEDEGWASFQSSLLSQATSGSMSVLDFIPIHHALRADSAGAPETHRQAAKMGEPWPTAEKKEMNNHATNGSFVKVKRSDVPRDRRIHKLVWVYKLKRDGTAKARLCVQGCTLEGGIDYDQTFASALKYSSARGLFAYAARNGCLVRSIDFVAAYLQGEFLDGEVVYVHMPPGYEEHDEDGQPYMLKVVKPVYGVQQSGRRLQRKIIPWMESLGLRQLDDSDNCVWVYDDPNSKETFALGIYVDNLQVVHSVELDDDGNAVDTDSFYHTFITKLRAEWDIVDEGPMVDLLGIQVAYNGPNSITLHQGKYIEAMLARFYPKGLPRDIARSTLPFTKSIRENVIDAIDCAPGEVRYPELVKPYQQRIGSLMYCCTACRVDIAYPVHLLCRCMNKPTPALMREVDHVFAYLARHTNVGLTFDDKSSTLIGFSDASWETRNSTSGWLTMWQSAPLGWGSNRQPCTALSSCEAEIIALSEAAKDMVYFRKFVAGLDASYISGPSNLSTDNQAARDLSYNPENHNKTKHVARRHFFIRDMVEALELRVPLVGTKDNYADFLTKPLEPKTFYALRALIMNERSIYSAAASSSAAARP